MPPTGTNVPSPPPCGRARTVRAGAVLTHAYCCAEEQAKTSSDTPPSAGHVGEGAGALAHGLAQRPQPRRVDVRVADAADPVRAGVRRPGQHLGEFGARGAAVPATSRESSRVQRRGPDAARSRPAARLPVAAARASGWSAPRCRGQVPDVLGRAPPARARDHVVHRFRSPAVRVRRSWVGWNGTRLRSPGWRRPPRRNTHVLAAGHRRRADGTCAVARAKPLSGTAVGRVDQALGLEARAWVGSNPRSNDGLHAPPGPLGRARCRRTGTRWWTRDRPTPRRSRTAGTRPADGERLGHRHGFAGDVPGADGQRGALGVECGMENVAEIPRDAVFHQFAVVVHGGVVPSKRWCWKCVESDASGPARQPAAASVTLLTYKGLVGSVTARRRSADRFCSSCELHVGQRHRRGLPASAPAAGHASARRSTGRRGSRTAPGTPVPATDQ